MKEFIYATSVIIDKPKSYGLFHLSFFFIGLIISIIVAFFLRKSNEKQNKIILLSVSIFLIFTEIYKQLFYYYVVDSIGYKWYIFPFQLCSVPMYLCLIVVFFKNEKFKECIYDFMFSVNLFGGLVTFLEPSGMNKQYLTITLHSYIWHMLLIFLGLYLFMSKRACNNIKGYFNSLKVFFIVFVVAQIFNITLKDTRLNMFYISPYVQSPMMIFKDIYIKFGWFANMIVYLFAVCLGSFLIHLLFYSIRKKIENKKLKFKNISI